MEQQVLTIVCKLNPTPEQSRKLEATLEAFAKACNFANQTVNPKITNKNRIQGEVYKAIREQFRLTANLAVRACARVAANRKTAKLKDRPIKQFKPTSADYDARVFSYQEKKQTVSLSTVEGRVRIPLVLGNYQIGKLKGKTPTSATLSKHRDGKLYIHIQVKDDVPPPQKPKDVIGVDLGRRDIAVTSEGQSWSGGSVNRIREQFARVRASVQAKGTKGAKRLLKRLSGRERRYQSWVNHNISKQIVRHAKDTQSIIALEDLTGIRERTNRQPRSKTERRRSNSWAFYQLRLFIDYKAIKEAVEVITVPPAYTSQTCHNCLHIHPQKGKSYRSGKTFKCAHCGWKGDADLNGATMIKRLGESVSLPKTRKPLSCSLLGSVTG
ncbi:Mobile element protein [Geitlerinema sp. FC II]|nr:Mobile element protein [Geitlerinema sp. FC II]